MIQQAKPRYKTPCRSVSLDRETKEVPIPLQTLEVLRGSGLELDTLAPFQLGSERFHRLGTEKDPHPRRQFNFVSDQVKALRIHVCGRESQRRSVHIRLA
jgi:hypothetical protein